MNEHAVVIVGAGPTGLMLAGELALAEVDVVVLERRPGQELAGARAGGLHTRTIEVLDQRGLADRFLSRGTTAQVAGYAGVPLDVGDLPTRHPYGLALWQHHVERILAERAGELGVPVHYGHDVTGVAQDGAGVDVDLSHGRRWRAQYVVGCDGGRSRVRRAAGIAFPGWDATTSSLLAEAETDEEPEWGIHQDALGKHAFRRTQTGQVGIMVTERHVGSGREPTLRELREALVAVYGTDYGVHRPTWLTRFTDTTRQAASYRQGRVLLAGDAAHVHAPDGGQGLNTGVQDAVNLGWKLAQVLRRTSPEDLLDTYHAERHPVAARVLRHTMAQVALRRPDERIRAVGETVAELLGMEEPRRRFAATMSGLDVHYDLGPGHPLLGRRMPDLDLRAADGTPRVYALLHEARPVLLELAEHEPDGVDLRPWADRVRRVRAECAGPWELPALGAVPAPTAVLIRPDGHVAWVGEGTRSGLEEALTTWCGAPARARGEEAGTAAPQP
ncbi:FAD-dependent monooxygenase [Kocuria sp. KH4]